MRNFQDGSEKSQLAFAHVPSEIGAYEAEEIGTRSETRAAGVMHSGGSRGDDCEQTPGLVLAGVEHLLRDVKDSTISTLASEVSSKLASLKGLEERLREISGYMDKVAEGKLPMNNDIMYHLQDVFNLLPNLNVNQLVKSFAVKTNDMLAVVYLAALIRSIIALHTLINNKVSQTSDRCHMNCWY